MSDSLESDSLPPLALPVAVPAVALRFCRKCGHPWTADAGECESCVARALHVVRQAQRDKLSLDEKQSLIQAVALYACLLAVSMMAILISIGQRRGLTLPQFVFEEAAFITVVIGWCAVAYRSLLQPLSRVGSWGWLSASPLLGCGTFLIASAVLLAIDRLVHTPTIQYLDTFHGTGHRFLLGVLFICLEPALFEELAFRGVIFAALRRTLGGNGETILVSAAMFAILHLSAPSFPHLFVMGVVLAWLRARTGSLFPGMVVHFTHNFLCIAVEQFGKGFAW